MIIRSGAAHGHVPEDSIQEQMLPESCFLWGPRQSGKSTLLRELFPEAPVPESPKTKSRSCPGNTFWRCCGRTGSQP